MTLSTLSMQMKALELELDVVLFDRSVRPPRLTPIGCAIVSKAAAVLESEDALLELCSPEDGLAGKFKIGFVTSAAARLLPSFLENTQRDMYRADFEFETGLSAVLQEKVRTGALDAAVVTETEVNMQGLSQVMLREEPFVFAASAQMAAKGLDALLRDETFFHFMPQTGIGKLISSAMQETDRLQNAPTIMLDNLEAIVGCVKTGLGFTLLPAPDLERYAQGELCIIHAPAHVRRALVLVTRTGHILSKHLNVLITQFNPV
jgi:DNA-binding transcriptional LysR family regulator